MTEPASPRRRWRTALSYAVLVLATADRPALVVLGFIAVVSGAANLFGGFVVTDRMLEMFKTKKSDGKKS